MSTLIYISFFFFPRILISRKFPKVLDASFVALIPKKEGAPTKHRSFRRSINLIGRIYKILATVLANRLCKVLSHVILTEQGAFVDGRMGGRS